MSITTLKTSVSPLSRALRSGLLTFALYGLFFSNIRFVMTFFTRGGLFFLLPIITVLLFSIVHGVFASNVWTLMGVVAKGPGSLPQAVPVRIHAARKAPVYTYSNTFLNLNVR